MTTYQKLSELRKDSGLSQEELAERMEVSRQTISRWETGATRPSADKLARLSQVLGVSADTLLGVESVPTAETPVEAPAETPAPVSRRNRGLLVPLAAPIPQDLEFLDTSWDDCPWLEEFSTNLVNGDYPRNAKGEPFGSHLDFHIVGYKPDWISCIGDHGVSGYFSAIAEKHLWQGIGDNVVDVYDMDGNIVDQFTFSGTSSCG